MKHGSLFSGIGGFDLAAEWMGWENVFHCEWNPFGQKVLKYYWPKAESFTDITKTDFTKYANTIDILTGGFPCQPYSSAGKRKGKEDERHLWPEMCRAIREIAPRYIVGENVRGLTNWNGGMVFDEVCAEMENLGYQVAPVLIPACGVNAPHRRERIFFVAWNSESKRDTKIKGIFEREDNDTFGICESSIERIVADSESNGRNKFGAGIDEREKHIVCDWNEIRGFPSSIGEIGDAADTDGIGNKSRSWGFSEQFDQNGKEGGIFTNTESIRRENALENGELERGRFRESYKRNSWDSFPSVSPICNGDDGVSSGLDGITFSKWRNESIKGGGNAIVPPLVYNIFLAIQEHERLTAPAPDIRQYV